MNKILVINDKKENLDHICSLLTECISDCRVTQAQSGNQGIQIAKTEPPDVVLLGIGMAEPNRYKICRRLKSDEATKHIPLIMLTDTPSNSENYAKGLEAGADAFLNPPVDKGELTSQISMVLRINALEKEKATLKKQLRHAQKMEAIGTLAGGIAHEFNNILFPIIGYTEMSLYDVPEDSKARKNLTSVLKAADRAKDLIQQILNFSRKGGQERNPLKVQYIIKETLKLLRASLPATIEIQQEIDTACGPIVADPSEIQQVVMDLCTHAYQAMEESGGVLKVTLSAVDMDSGALSSETDLNPGSYMQLTVGHTDHYTEITSPEPTCETYESNKDPREYAEMGLDIVNDIIQNYKGKIAVCREANLGSTIKVYIPLIHNESKNMQSMPNDPQIPMGSETILLVDDEEDVVEMMHSMLERLGYQVTSTLNSIEALGTFRLQSETFDLVITDQTMPQMTGMELVRELRRIRPDIPVILCTGFNEKITEDHTHDLGVEALLSKPVRVREISEKIRKVLDRNM